MSGDTPPTPRDNGFTLVEALVALTILAIAAVGLIGAAEAHINSIAALESRSAAQWVAENRIAELTVAPDLAPPDYAQVEMLGQTFTVRIAGNESEDPDLDAMTISVSELNAAEALVTMNFFLDRKKNVGQ